MMLKNKQWLNHYQSKMGKTNPSSLQLCRDLDIKSMYRDPSTQLQDISLKINNLDKIDKINSLGLNMNNTGLGLIRSRSDLNQIKNNTLLRSETCNLLNQLHKLLLLQIGPILHLVMFHLLGLFKNHRL
eukprot:NODE_188_length_15619_cov_0.374871.p9 type:complete len:129 gc:universal NODE_188_length_15619_cov_0.374871:10204-9818(-)